MNDIFTVITTKQELQEMLQSLANIEQQLFTNAHAQTLIEANFPYHISQAILADMRKVGVDMQNQRQFHDWLIKLNTQAEHIPYIGITLSHMPAKPTLERILQWIHSNLSLHHVLDVTVDPTLIGGSMIRYQGRYQDHSLRKLIDAYFEKNPADHPTPHMQ